MSAAVLPFVPAIAGFLGLGASIYQGERQASAAKDARNEASRRADAEVTRQKTELEKAGRKRRSARTQQESLQRGAGAISQKGPATRLTGPGGISSSVLSLARNTLLG